MTTARLTDQALVDGFEGATLAEGEFGHTQHVRAAWLCLQRDGLWRALDAFPAALRRFALAKGAPQLFHATITWAYLLLIHERQHLCHADRWEEFALANPDLLTWKPSILDDYYTPETLWSEVARERFVMPDRGIRQRGSDTALMAGPRPTGAAEARPQHRG